MDLCVRVRPRRELLHAAGTQRQVRRRPSLWKSSLHQRPRIFLLPSILPTTEPAPSRPSPTSSPGGALMPTRGRIEPLPDLEDKLAGALFQIGCFLCPGAAAGTERRVNPTRGARGRGVLVSPSPEPGDCPSDLEVGALRTGCMGAPHGILTVTPTPLPSPAWGTP